MSFLNIKNPEERDAMIEDYLALKERLKKRRMEERGQRMDRLRDLEEDFEPVVASNKKMAKEIVDELTPITKELHELNTRPKLAAVPTVIGLKRDIDSQPKSKQRLSSSRLGPYAEAFLTKYLNPDTRNQQVDTTFGIRYENDSWMIGNKQIEINGDDITIDGEVYEGTSGLWSLITDKIPTKYTENDFQRYKELLYETSALHQHYDSRSRYPRASGGKKWTQILRPIWNEFQMTGVVESSEEDDDDDDDGDDDDSIDGMRVDEEDDDDDGDDDDSIDGTRVDANSDDDSDNDELHNISDASDLADGNGVKMYLQKNGRCFGLQKCGNGLKFTPRPKLSGIRGNGLYLRVGSSIYDGHGLILGSQSPFKHIPILGWLL